MTSGLKITDNVPGGLGCLEHGLQPLPCVSIGHTHMRSFSRWFMQTPLDWDMDPVHWIGDPSRGAYADARTFRLAWILLARTLPICLHTILHVSAHHDTYLRLCLSDLLCSD